MSHLSLLFVLSLARTHHSRFGLRKVALAFVPEAADLLQLEGDNCAQIRTFSFTGEREKEKEAAAAHQRQSTKQSKAEKRI